jgi:hypothetical protein
MRPGLNIFSLSSSHTLPVETAVLPFVIILERHDPARHMTHYSPLALERNLFGACPLMRMQGRIGQTRLTLCADLPAAQNS